MKERANAFLRWGDRYLGIPLVNGLSLFHRKRPFLSTWNKIALLKTAGIGDTVLLSSLITALQEICPQVAITLFTGKSNSSISSFLPTVTVIPLKMTSPYESLKIIRSFSYDIWIDCDPWPRINTLFSFFSRSQFTIGFKTPHQARGNLYDLSIAHQSNCHELDNYARLLSPFGISSLKAPSLSAGSSSSPQKTIAFHMFSAGSKADLKHWPTKQWIDLGHRLIEKGYRIALTGSHEDLKKCLDIYQKLPSDSVELLAGKLSLYETGTFLLSCACLVSVDTGIHHLAAALGCPVVSLHGPTSPQRWGAKGNKVVALCPPFPYHPCLSLGFESRCKVNTCMRGITLEQVENAIDKLLK